MVEICANQRRCSTTSSRVRLVTAIICVRIRRMTEPRETKNSSQAVGFSRTITVRLPENELTTTTINGRNSSLSIAGRTADERPHAETLLLPNSVFRLRRRFLSRARLREQTADHVAEQLGRPRASCKPRVHQPGSRKFIRLRHHALLDPGQGRAKRDGAGG